MYFSLLFLTGIYNETNTKYYSSKQQRRHFGSGGSRDCNLGSREQAGLRSQSPPSDRISNKRRWAALLLGEESLSVAVLPRCCCRRPPGQRLWGYLNTTLPVLLLCRLTRTSRCEYPNLFPESAVKSLISWLCRLQFIAGPAGKVLRP